MKVSNQNYIRRLSFRFLRANRRRNCIAVFAIALTTLLFTSLFTIVLSLNSSYETYQFRQLGGYAHGTFKDVSPEQEKRIAAHPRIRQTGARKVIGISTEGVFAKIPAEVSYMDANCTKWSYATPTTGRMPANGKEVAMDTAALGLLGVTPELGAEVSISYSVTDKDQTAFPVTDTFTLVGFWDYDDLMPVHYVNISADYAASIERKATEMGLDPFRVDLNVMLASTVDIRGQMEQVDTDLGYTWDSYTDPNSVRIGVNWGYTTAQISSQIDPQLVIAMAAFLLLVIFTGYLIICNIFQISVTGDIRFYGLLKTIGTTPRQLKRVIRQQALLLCVVGIPAGLLLGLWRWSVAYPCCNGENHVWCRCHNHQRIPVDFSRRCSICLGYGPAVLFPSRPNRRRGIACGGQQVYGSPGYKEKTPCHPWSPGVSDGLCQFGAKQTEVCPCHCFACAFCGAAEYFGHVYRGV